MMPRGTIALKLRLPHYLHERMKAASVKSGCSLNAEILNALDYATVMKAVHTALERD